MVKVIGLSLIITSHCVLDINDMPLRIRLHYITLYNHYKGKINNKKSKQAQNDWAERTQKIIKCLEMPSQDFSEIFLKINEKVLQDKTVKISS